MKKSIKKISNIVTQITVGEPDFPGVSPPNMWLVAGFDRCALIDTAYGNCLLYTSPSPRDLSTSRMPSSA